MFSFMRMSLQGTPRRTISALCLPVVVILLISACRKADEPLRLSPDGGRVDGIVADNLSLIGYTIEEDSVKVDSLTSNLLGAMNDPGFGKSEATLVTQVQIPEINIDFGGIESPDSIVLSIAYKHNSRPYGNMTSPQTITVFRLEEDLVASKSYYSGYNFQKGAQLGQWTGVFNTEDSVYYMMNGEMRRDVPQMRINLSAAFGQEFFDADPTVYTGKSAFLDFLKGFILQPDAASMAAGDGMIAEMDLTSTASKLTIYYGDSLSKSFPVTPESERINTYAQSDRKSEIQAQIDQPGVNYAELFVQAMAGTKVKIDLPDIFDLVADGRVMINEARITLPVKSGTVTEDYDAPPRLLLLQPSEKDGSNAFILDLIDQIAPLSPSWIGFGNYGGIYDEANEQYVFRFTRHLQDLLDAYYIDGEDNNRGFYIVIPSDNPVTPARVILDNDTTGSGRAIELKITYTKL